MAEYIDRDEAICRFGERTWAAAVLENIPAADVAPVVHGKNIGIEYADCDQFVCSECGIELQGWYKVERDEDDGDVTYHEHTFNYCPNCGADCRGADNG